MNTECHSANQNIHAIRNVERCNVRLCGISYENDSGRRFRTDRLTRLVPTPVRFVLRNDVLNMKTQVIILLFLFVAIGANAQFFDNTLVKVRPFKFFFNPNVGLEKPLSSMFSISAEVAYHRFDNFYDGSLKGQYFDNDWFGYPSKVKFNGAEIAVGGRMYLMSFPNKYLEGYYWIAPFGLYYEAIVDYSHSWFYDAQIYDYGRSVYEGVNYPYYRADVRLDNLSIIMLIGFQHNFMNTLSIDLNIGARYYCISNDNREVLSVSPIYDDVAVGDDIRNKNPRWQIAGRFTIGYYIRYDWMKRKK